MGIYAEQMAEMSKMQPGSTERYIYNPMGGRTLNPFYTAPKPEQRYNNAGQAVYPGGINPNKAPAAPRPSVEALAPTGPSYQDQWAREDRLAAEKRARQDELMTRFGSMFDSGNVPATVSRTQGPTAEQEAASRDAAFARAKETAGMNARASMQSLQDAVGERGMMGSSVEGAQTGAIIGGAAGDVGEFLRDQAVSEADRATRVADTEYQGQVTQRGQTLGRQQQQQQALLSLIGGLY